jgi:GAF domain-containing protein
LPNPRFDDDHPYVPPNLPAIGDLFDLFKLPEDLYQAFLSVPVLSRDKLVGVINLQHRQPHNYSQREIHLISTIGFLVGAEIEMARLEGENFELSEQLATRKVIERAKGILQRDLQLSEQEVYVTLQRQSRQRRKSMKEIAEAIVLSDDVKRTQASQDLVKSAAPSHAAH